MLQAIIVSLYEGRGSRSECSSYKGMSLLSVPETTYRRILTERLMEVTEGKVSEEQEGLRKGRGCVDQIFAMEMLVEEYIGVLVIQRPWNTTDSSYDHKASFQLTTANLSSN